MRSSHLVIWYAICLHWIWGTLLLMSPTPLWVTGIATIPSLGFVDASTVGAFYLAIAFMALMGLAAPKYVGTIFLLPQQIVLVLSAYGAIHAMHTGAFADGVIRSTPFIIADQLPAVLLAVFHIISVHMGCFLWERRGK